MKNEYQFNLLFFNDRKKENIILISVETYPREAYIFGLEEEIKENIYNEFSGEMKDSTVYNVDCSILSAGLNEIIFGNIEEVKNYE